MRFGRIFAIAVAAAALAACSGGASVAQARNEVDDFHRLMGAGNYKAIWADTSQEMRDVTNEDQLTKLMAAVAGKLGKATKSEQVGWKQSFNNGDKFVEVNMKTTFEKGSGEENFVFRRDGDNLKLAGWHIQSNELITN